MKSVDFTPFFERLKAATPIQNQSQLAEALGIGRAAVSAAKLKNKVPSSWVVTLSEKFSLASSDLIGPTGSATSAHSGTFPEASKAFTKIERLSMARFDTDWLATLGNPQKMMVLTVSGDNMVPDILPGDHVVIDSSQRTPVSGHLFVLETQSGPSIRRLDLIGNRITLINGNQSYPPLTLSPEELDKLAILGRVVLCIRSYSSRSTSPPGGATQQQTPGNQQRQLTLLPVRKP